jgi:aspartate carbamoyltransferase regulatory subunit
VNIDGIKNGIVLDHITAGLSMDIYHTLQLDKMDCCVAIIKNVVSKKQGRKDILKVDAEMDLDLDVLGFIDPGITVNIIRDWQRVEKKTLSLPNRLKNVIQCKNPRCITSTEQEIDQVFTLAERDASGRPVYRCHYCETAYSGR